MGEPPLSTLSIPSEFAPPPKMAVRILSPAAKRFAQGEGATLLSSKPSDLLGPVAVPGLKIICISMPVRGVLMIKPLPTGRSFKKGTFRGAKNQAVLVYSKSYMWFVSFDGIL